jgi:hypothetical protein
VAATYVSHATVTSGSGTTPSIGGFSVTAGNAVIMLINVSSARTCSGYADDQGGTWAEQVDANDGVRTVIIARCVNHPGGTITTSCTLSATGSWVMTLIQVTGQDNTTPDADTDTLATAAETNTVIYASQATNFNVPDNSFVCFVTRSNGSNTATPLTGYTMITTTSLSYQFGYRAFTTGENDHRTGFTKSNDSRASMGGSYCMAESAGAPSGQPFRKRWGGVPHSPITSRGVW